MIDLHFTARVVGVRDIIKSDEDGNTRLLEITLWVGGSTITFEDTCKNLNKWLQLYGDYTAMDLRLKSDDCGDD